MEYKYGDPAFYEQLAKSRAIVEQRFHNRREACQFNDNSMFGGIKNGFRKLFSGFATSDDLEIDFNKQSGMILSENDVGHIGFKNGNLPGRDITKLSINPEKKEKMSSEYYKAEMERMVTMMSLIEEQRSKMIEDLTDATEKAQGVKNVAFCREVREYRQKLVEENESILADVKEMARVEGRAQGEAELIKKEDELKIKERNIESQVRSKTREAEEQMRMAQAKLDHAKMLEGKVQRIKDENEYLIEKNGDLLADKDVNMEFLCVVCMSDTKNCLLEPCNHLAMCISCYNAGNIRTCPCCREQVTGMRKVFI